jgi:hypothetical protein
MMKNNIHDADKRLIKRYHNTSLHRFGGKFNAATAGNHDFDRDVLAGSLQPGGNAGKPAG